MPHIVVSCQKLLSTDLLNVLYHRHLIETHNNNTNTTVLTAYRTHFEMLLGTGIKLIKLADSVFEIQEQMTKRRINCSYLVKNQRIEKERSCCYLSSDVRQLCYAASDSNFLLALSRLEWIGLKTAPLMPAIM